jgi:hypothetical protein
MLGKVLILWEKDHEYRTVGEGQEREMRDIDKEGHDGRQERETRDVTAVNDMLYT